MDEVVVTAPGHLHVGNFDLSGDLGRLFGTVGFSIEEPSLEVELKKNEDVQASDRDARFFAEVLCEEHDLSGVEIQVNCPLPKFVGIGHHTTLALSIGVGLSELYDLSLSIEEVALTVKRGLITALGLYACKCGGFVIEGGFRPERMEEMVPPLIFQRNIPDDWIFVIAIPREPRERIAELRKEREDRILKEGVTMSPKTSAELSRLVLVKMMPSIAEEDIESFGESLTEFNSRLGDVWSDHQEGKYADGVVERGIELVEGKSHCACQSSWGPTFYGLTDDESDALDLRDELEEFLEGNGGGGVFRTKSDNQGLEVK